VVLECNAALNKFLIVQKQREYDELSLESTKSIELKAD